jgi:hypothetical protein
MAIKYTDGHILVSLSLFVIMISNILLYVVVVSNPVIRGILYLIMALGIAYLIYVIAFMVFFYLLAMGFR